MPAALAPTTKLDAVNAVLASGGRTPVSTITGALSNEAATALNEINRALREVCARAPYFCILREYVLDRDGNNKYPVAANVLEADVESGPGALLHLAPVDGFLVDLLTNDDTPDLGATVTARLVVLREFEEMPEAARQHVYARAARRYNQYFVRNADLVRAALLDEEDAKGVFAALCTRQSDANLQKTYHGSSLLSRIRPD